MLGRGAQIKATALTEEFGAEDYLNQNGKNVIPLFGLSPDQKQLLVFTAQNDLGALSNGWKVIGLIHDKKGGVVSD